ncbi:MAG: hypothetical protein ACE5Z5_01810 [Candidatus Bathyarchaeia archaeon]
MEANEVSWSYAQLDLVPAPVVGVVVDTPRGRFPEKEEAQIRVDTGYEGFLLLKDDLYSDLGFRLSEVPRRFWPIGVTVSGEVFTLRRALVVIHIPKARMRLGGYVDTFRGNMEDLLGLKFLDKLRLLLDGPTQRAQLIE